MSQRNRLFDLLYDLKPHRTDEIVREVYGEGLSLSRVGARIYDLKELGYDIVGWKDRSNPTLYWYRLESRLAVRGANSRTTTTMATNKNNKQTPIYITNRTQGSLFVQGQHGEEVVRKEVT